MVVVLGQDEKAKYPFLADAREYLQDKGFSLLEFGTDPALKISVDKAFERVMAAVHGNVFKSELYDGGIASKPHVLETEVFSFLLAIVLIKLANKSTLIKRFALAESRRAEHHLERDLSTSTINSYKTELATKILYELFEIKVIKRDNHFTIPVPDYLKHSVVFHEREWKLINRRVEGGKVILTSEKMVRLIRRELGVYITSRIDNAPAPDMIPGFEKMVEKLRNEADRLTPVYVITKENPPCIKHAMGVLEKGENLPHSGRFMLATFLLSRGQSIEQIAPLFKNAPDYNERITLYQLNHLAGTSGSGTKYMCPSCEKIKTRDLCFATEECNGIINPLQFGRTTATATTSTKPPGR